ncbi:glutaredoxin [Seongchinamella unica]|uniref:Glutaredoxin n=1 Tax=Seongchinamella unica TaxID=2547392 RepID=A0A4R5LNF4_9GAMM|nr:glutathione S-transferase N-terminal domain-containing protein [Seongchinamella unica]TDG11664.1 glutaredoxin [Seongchinamella unica]
MRIIRLVLGKLILFFNWVFTPRSIKRDPAAQAVVDQQTASLALYQYEACPFCVKVRRAMKRNGLNIETRDVKRSESAREELQAGGGNLKVPCLRIEDNQGQAEWMYESSDIIRYLERRFDPAAHNPVAA